MALIDAAVAGDTKALQSPREVEAARAAGRFSIKLGAAIPGEPLCKALGHAESGRDETATPDGARKVVINMRNSL